MGWSKLENTGWYPSLHASSNPLIASKSCFIPNENNDDYQIDDTHSDYKMVITDFPSISEDDLVLIRVDLLASHILRMSCEHVDSQFGIQQVVSFG